MTATTEDVPPGADEDTRFLPRSRWEWAVALVLLSITTWLVTEIWSEAATLNSGEFWFVVGSAVAVTGLSADIWARVFGQAELVARSQAAGWTATAATFVGVIVTVVAPSFASTFEPLPKDVVWQYLVVLGGLSFGFGLATLPIYLIRRHRDSSSEMG
ncbi:hypothetical protein Pve01_94360 [Planomonospora venezuelensis]|nr:hypothetical protein Pve01_94360 [Planomonospora venezuelensis]